jgi:hypothetical protein
MLIAAAQHARGQRHHCHVPATTQKRRLQGRRGSDAADHARRGEAKQHLPCSDHPELDDYRYYYSTRVDLLRRIGRGVEARVAYARGRANPAGVGAAFR